MSEAEREPHPPSASAANVNDTLTSLSTSLCSWCILVCNPSSRLFIMTGSTRGDCHRLRDGNMKRSCLSVSGSGEVTVFSMFSRRVREKKMKAFVRFWFLFLSISFLMTMTMISLCRSPIFDGYGLFNEGFCILKTTNVS